VVLRLDPPRTEHLKEQTPPPKRKQQVAVKVKKTKKQFFLINCFCTD